MFFLGVKSLKALKHLNFFKNPGHKSTNFPHRKQEEADWHLQAA